MKLTNTHTLKAKSGMTLLELTVVILVLLSLISILFVGARAWKKGSDRAANIMNIRNAQQAMRGHANLNGLPETTGVVTEAIVFGPAGDGVNGYLRKPLPPCVEIATYTGAGTVPVIGTLWMTAAYADAAATAAYAPATAVTSAW
jgi:prepilin-type N-terminal cleavage/methylation domain-containing protein